MVLATASPSSLSAPGPAARRCRLGGRDWRGAVLAALAALFCWGPAHPPNAHAENFIGDLSDRQVAIASNFTGRRLTLFGAIDETADSLTQQKAEGELNIVVVVRGPSKPIVVRHKSRLFGVWVNTQSVTFNSVPVFYYVASYLALDAPHWERVYHRYEIRPKNLRYEKEGKPAPGDTLQFFRDAVVRLKEKQNLFIEESGGVTLKENLFRAEIDLPANVPVGVYNVEFYMFRGNKLISSQSEPLYINKTGIGRTVYEFSDDSPFWYGVLAVIAALFFGWIASLIFRRE